MTGAGWKRATLLCGLCALLSVVVTAAPHAPLLRDDADRAAFRAWFTTLADAQFERRTPDVTDCASLVRHAYREALRSHSAAWLQSARLPRLLSLPDVRQRPSTVEDGAWLLFRVQRSPERYAEFADADTLVTLNARRLGRDVRAAQPGDLLYFRQDAADSPAHLMVFVGESRFDAGHDWVVYHTGPDGSWPGEVRKVALHDLARHPSARWRPIVANPAFVGVFRLAILDREQ